jgi:excisionase family DNA binding protein
VTIPEAARYLGVTDRTIRNYIRQGLLSTSRIAGKREKYLRAEEIEELRVSLTEGKHLIPRREISALSARVRRLEAQLEVVLRVLDARVEPLKITPAYAKELITACKTKLTQVAWTLSEIQPWTEIFLRLDEDDLDVLAADCEKPWALLLRLCAAMTACVVADTAYETSLELQSLHRTLVEGRRRLRVAALLHVERSGASDPLLNQRSVSIGDAILVSIR